MKRPPSPTTDRGAFVISLDFELYWGVHDRVDRDAFQSTAAATRRVVERLLALFEEREIAATWAAVGLLLHESHESARASSPLVRPNYRQARLNTYSHLDGSGGGWHDGSAEFARDLASRVCATPHQELASHTFAHVYCLEEAFDAKALRHDLRAAMAAGEALGRRPVSIVFPRNQYNQECLEVAREVGFKTYRGNPPHRLYKPRPRAHEHRAIRGLRLLDAYGNLTGHHTYPPPTNGASSSEPLNVPASMFLRSGLTSYAPERELLLRRIKAAMTYAAQRGEVFHLWWHPHNFANGTDRRFAELCLILDHMESLRRTYGFRSVSMADVAGVEP